MSDETKPTPSFKEFANWFHKFMYFKLTVYDGLDYDEPTGDEENMFWDRLKEIFAVYDKWTGGSFVVPKGTEICTFDEIDEWKKFYDKWYPLFGEDWVKGGEKLNMILLKLKVVEEHMKDADEPIADSVWFTKLCRILEVEV